MTQTGLFDDPAPCAPDLKLRWYQAEARERVAEVHSRTRGALVAHATGLGKTTLAASIIWDYHVRGLKSLMICPTITLTRQTYTALRAHGLTATIEQADNKAYRPLPAVTVACVASMRGDRLAGFASDEFGLIVIDECHSAVAPRYMEIVKHFSGAKLCGLTATTDRADGLSLGNVFDELAHEVPMLRGISEGFLAPLKFQTATTDFDATRLRTIAGEVDAGSVAAELVRSGALHEAANTLAALAPDRLTIAFLPTVASSKAFTAELAACGVPAAHIDGTTPMEVREQYFAAFKSRDVRVLSNVGCLIEGFDAPHASVVALLNPTKSRGRLTQMIGRGTRLCEGKESTLVIDFCPGRMKKGRLASPADALAGKMLPDAVHDQLASEGDLAEAIERAEVKAAELEERKAKAEARAKVKAEQVFRLKEEVKKRAFVYGLEEHDMHSLLGGYGDPLVRLSQAGVDVPQVEAKRRAQGLCSLKQANLLKKYKLNPNLRWKDARVAIDAICANEWRVPSHIASDPRYT